MRTAALILLLSIAAFAQTAPPVGFEAASAHFEVASIKASDSGGLSIETGPSSLTIKHARINTCIAWAFDIQEFQIVGPNWMNDVNFDIFARSAAPASETELRKMLQALLADRFKFAFHRENKEMSSLILVVGPKGHKLTPADTAGNPSFKTGKMSLTGMGATLEEFTRFLSREMHEPVVDQTGLKGLFNYSLDINAYVTDEMRRNDGPPMEANAIIGEAVLAQMGLKVESKKLPVPMVVIDHLEKAPTEN